MAQTCRVKLVATAILSTMKGTKPGDIPIEEPMTFELIVNARLAKSFDLTLPTSVLISADELIE